MKMFDSLKTLNKYHEIYKTLSFSQKKRFALAVEVLFDEKTISAEGAYDNYKITEKDLTTIHLQLI